MVAKINTRGIVHLQGSWILFVIGLALFVLYFGILITGPEQQQNTQMIPSQVDQRMSQDFLIDFLYSPLPTSENSSTLSLYIVIEHLLEEEREPQLQNAMMIRTAFDQLFGEFGWALQICGQGDDSLGLATLECQTLCFEETNTLQADACFLSENRKGQFSSRRVLEYYNKYAEYRELTVLRR